MAPAWPPKEPLGTPTWAPKWSRNASRNGPLKRSVANHSGEPGLKILANGKAENEQRNEMCSLCSRSARAFCFPFALALLSLWSPSVFRGFCLRVFFAHFICLFLGPSCGPLETLLEPSWALLGPLWTLLGSLGALVGPSRGPFGALLGPSWSPLGALLGSSWGSLGALWGSPGALLAPSWRPLGLSRGPLGALLL